MTYKTETYDKRAKKFISKLRLYTEEFLGGTPNCMFLQKLKSLKRLFDSFAIIDIFASPLVINCYHEIKISLMKLERFTDKQIPYTQKFKAILKKMYVVMDSLYHYEYFGYFSTKVLADPFSMGLNYPVMCGCAAFWPVEPYLTEEGKVAYENVIRFEDPKKPEYFCISMRKTPRLLEDRRKCSMSDKDLEGFKNFVIKNRDILILHACDYMVLDSSQFISALELKARLLKPFPKYRIAYTLKNRLDSEDNTAGYFYVDMNDMTYPEAVKFYKAIQDELKVNTAKDEEFDIYKPFVLKSLEILPIE